MNMSRDPFLGKSTQFFSGHGCLAKNTLTQPTLEATMSADSAAKRVQLNLQYTFFSECAALTDTRRGLFNDPYPI